MTTDELDVKITVRSVIKIVAASAAVVGMWTTMVMGQQDNTRRLARIEQHIGSMDSTLAVARVLYMTRAEVHGLVREADSTHAALRARLQDIEARLGHF